METFKQLGGRAALGMSAVGALIMTGIVLAGPASATADPISTAFDDLESKVTLYGTALVTLVVLAIGILFGIGWLKKARSAK